MNVFVLCTGRCGSTTFTRACKHINNYTVSHESKKNEILENRLSYPSNHIEVDNRLSWFLGRIDKKYGRKAFYVHLKRDLYETAKSFKKRYNMGIINSYKKGIVPGGKHHEDIRVCKDYCLTVNQNIQMFLKDKNKKMDFELRNARDDFETFWRKIGAEGELSRALSEWGKNYNRSGAVKESMTENIKKPYNLIMKIGRAVRGLPEYWKNV